MRRSRRRRTSASDWQPVAVVVNDPGALWPNSNWWINPTISAEVAFALHDASELVQVVFEPTKDKRAWKPHDEKANRERWRGIAEGASNGDPKRYWGFMQPLPTPRQARRAQEKLAERSREVAPKATPPPPPATRKRTPKATPATRKRATKASAAKSPATRKSAAKANAAKSPATRKSTSKASTATSPATRKSTSKASAATSPATRKSTSKASAAASPATRKSTSKASAATSPATRKGTSKASAATSPPARKSTSKASTATSSATPPTTQGRAKKATARRSRTTAKKRSSARATRTTRKKTTRAAPKASASKRTARAEWADAALEATLADAHIPSLVNALVHLTGDATLIRGDIRPTSQLFGDPQGGIAPADQEAIRKRALEALKAHRDAGFPALPQPSPELVKEMVDFIIGAELDASYGEFLLSELKIFDEDPYAVSFDDVPAARRNFHVVVVGAGMSGLLAAIRLKQAGIPYTVFEKNADVGGTWFENRYPGCRVDSPNHTYSYSFAPNDWPNHFSPQQVLLDYFNRIADENGIRENIRFATEVTEARFVDDNAWEVTVSGPKGDETLRANAIISAVGQLNRPKLPQIDGGDSFRGPAFHTARWEAEHDLAGKRIAVIGTGASAFQTVPEIAQAAERVTVFQRTPPWVAPRAEYHDAISDAKHWLLNNVPFYAKWHRFWMFWTTAEGLLAMVRRDPDWRDARSVSEANDQLRAMLTANIEAMVGDDPELYAKCVPDYPPAGKRMLVDNGHWFRALKRDNVELVTDPIANINANGIETESGRQVDADVLIYATGFHASRLLFPMRIYGKDGVELHERWGADPRAYLGIVVPGYPNLFCCYGPNTNIVVNGSIIFFSECEVRYIMGCLRLLMERGDAAMDCLADVHDAYNERIDAGNIGMAWGAENVSSWYKNEHGRVTQNWPFTLLEFWQQTKAPTATDFAFS